MMQHRSVVILVIIPLMILQILLMQPNEAQASRVLDQDNVLMLQSLQRGPVRPSGPNGCTYIPGRGGAPCTSQRGFAGRAVAAPNAYPDNLMVPFGVAANQK
ncbi:hypothetical protein HS088_TW12G00102 [Tripterygium wilfordii]|uniref:Rapid ALkalinization Factor n=1 Tax=Tripterygium wilfordii TaxID=458696 RepID=A0A7J7CYF4_TRIWF|nr:uncharacterized protein LOC120010052 [Tripterygium wilfordii]KAF5738906.1 hypothetical protein HS088_TW12G00102 [Tripterygium wilfordii]